MPPSTGPLAQVYEHLNFLGGLIWGNCCGGRRSQRNDTSFHEFVPLLSSEPARIDRVQAPCMLTHPAGGVQRPELVLVMRHAHREDEDNEDWSDTAARPWDPALSPHGRAQAKEAAQNLVAAQSQLKIEYVVTSPFLRCLQTSSEIVSQLQLPPGRWLVDFGMGEMCDPRLLIPGRPDMERRLMGRPIDSWMWGDASSSDDALRRFMAAESDISHPAIQPNMLSRPCAPFPESHESAMDRYQEELVWIMDGGMLRGNVLVVTHGEAVRTAVNMYCREATVYEVKHCAYVRLERMPRQTALAESCQGQDDEKMDLGMDRHEALLAALPNKESSVTRGWRLTCSSGETGVSWFS